MKIYRNYQKDEVLRKSMSKLSKQTFGLDFERLYDLGYWDEAFGCYGIVVDGEIVSNISFHQLDIVKDGKVYQGLQLGTVMTAESYRGKGYAGILMEAVLKDFEDKQVIYLFANASVMAFYPKYGFHPVEHIRHYQTKELPTFSSTKAKRLDLQQDMALLDMFVKNRHQNSRHDYVKGDDYLKMFYAIYMFDECVYRVDDAIIICQKDGETLKVHDIYSQGVIDYDKVLGSFMAGIKRIEYGYEPCLPTLNCSVDESSGLFVKSNIKIMNQPWCYPITSIT